MSLASEQLEEGEIIDDDDFEEISDNSITDFTIGKFVPPNENLRALSLSSDSELDIKLTTVTKSKKKLQHRKCKHHKKRRHIKSESTDSDFSTEFDLSENIRIKGKLKEAVHIEDLEMGQKRSLEARLKAMGGLPPDSIPTPQPSPPSLSNSDESDKIDDSELEKLRIEALKTAFLNKNQMRKKRKALETQQVQPSEVLDNKENNTPEQQTEKLTPDLDDDEDVLRASLLAGLAKKITTIPPPTIEAFPAPKAQIKIVQPLKKFAGSGGVSVVAPVPQKRIQPQVKPLIIKLNGDSDSTEEEEPVPLNGKTPMNEISSTVEQFLKEQRAKFEIETEKKNTEVLTSNNNTVKTPKKDILEKSAVKLLPKSQQIEYQQLLKKIKNAENQNKLKNFRKKAAVAAAKKVTLPKVTVAQEQQEAKGASAPKLPLAPVVANNELQSEKKIEKKAKEKDLESEIVAMKSEVEAERKRMRLTHELTTLRRTLREVRTQRNGSLQIKMRYQVLTPIMKKITEASQERRKHEERIRSLLLQLNESRANLTKSHDQFSMLVKELTNKKQIIDRSSAADKKPAAAPPAATKLAQNSTSTTHSSNSGSTSNILVGFRNIVTSTPLKPSQVPVVEEACSFSSIAATPITQQNNHYDEDMDVCNSDEMDMCQIEIVDPNDIDQIFRRRPPPPPKSTIPDYVSPLNLNASRYNNVDPLGIMCPYEVNGSCRDLDCSFKHYLKH